MSVWAIPWLELAVVVPLVGAASLGRFRDPVRAFRCGYVFTAAALACAVLAWAGVGTPPSASVQPYLFGRRLFAVDPFSAPLVAIVALLHFLTAVATGRTKMRRFSLTWSLVSESVRLATFACTEPWLLIGLLAAGTITPYVELLNRRRPNR